MTRVPPEHAELQFACNNRSGTVHVLPYVPPPSEGGPATEVMSFGEGLAAMAATPISTLCGKKLRIGMAGSATFASPGDFTGAFSDNDLCVACVRLLGDQAYRAFEHPQTPEEEEF